MKAVVRMNEVSFSYGRAPLLVGINLELYPGRIYSFIGYNGSGKSTLFKLAAGLLKPSSGEVSRSGKVVLVPQRPEDSISKLRVEDELTYVNILLGMSREAALDRVLGLMRELGIDEGFLKRNTFELSYGWRRLLVLIEYATLDFDCLMLDEPTANLSDDWTERIWDLFYTLRASNKCVAMITHRAKDLIGADEVLMLSDGRLRTVDLRELRDRNIEGPCDEDLLCLMARALKALN